MRTHHQWRHKSKHQQICATCKQVRRWNGVSWRYRKQGQLVKERPPCLGGRTDSERYRELRKIVEAYQSAPDDAAVLFAMMSWKHGEYCKAGTCVPKESK